MGVGRSGTSLATRVAHSIGLHLPIPPDVMPPNPANPSGYFESTLLSAINDKLLALWRCSWWQPPPAVTDSMLQQLDDKAPAASDAFTSVFESGWVWKDPRLTVLLPFWERVLGSQPVLVVFREPQGVARSLVTRDKVTYEQGLAIWERHTRLALANLPGRRVLLRSYQSLCNRPAAWRSDLLAFCLSAGLPVRQGVDQPPRITRSRSSADGWISPEQAELLTLLLDLEGTHTSFPAVSPRREPDWVSAELRGPRLQQLSQAVFDWADASPLLR